MGYVENFLSFYCLLKKKIQKQCFKKCVYEAPLYLTDFKQN